MFKLNEYFDGKVKSLSFASADGPATVGVMAAGEYEFTTSTCETMIVVSGRLAVRRSGEAEWKDCLVGEMFSVGSGKSFRVKTEADAAYLCLYK
jgi:purine/pyrimidine-nucleoside phosphorylase